MDKQAYIEGYLSKDAGIISALRGVKGALKAAPSPKLKQIGDLYKTPASALKKPSINPRMGEELAAPFKRAIDKTQKSYDKASIARDSSKLDHYGDRLRKLIDMRKRGPQPGSVADLWILLKGMLQGKRDWMWGKRK